MIQVTASSERERVVYFITLVVLFFSLYFFPLLHFATEDFPPEEKQVVTIKEHVQITPRNSSGITVLLWQRGLMEASRACERLLTSKCKRSMFPVDFLRISRLFNPNTTFVLLVDKAELESKPYFAAEMKKLSVQIIYREHYRRNTSRALRYEDIHTRVGGIHDKMMMSRFCEWSDVVSKHGFKRILTIDSDVALFQNVDEAFRSFSEDIVSPCKSCSQVVLWRPKALSNFCDAHIDYLSLNDKSRTMLYEKYGDPSSLDEQKRWNDMRMLEAFMLEKQFNYGFSSISLSDERPNARNPLPFVWLAGLTIQAYDPEVSYTREYNPKLLWGNLDCRYFDVLFHFRRMSEEEPKSAFLTSANARLPLMHFHQKCKIEYGHLTYVKHYQHDYEKNNQHNPREPPSMSQLLKKKSEIAFLARKFQFWPEKHEKAREWE
jgi:hypothetical protein